MSKTLETIGVWYVGIWMIVTTGLGALALVRWSLRVIGWLP